MPGTSPTDDDVQRLQKRCLGAALSAADGVQRPHTRCSGADLNDGDDAAVPGDVLRRQFQMTIILSTDPEICFGNPALILLRRLRELRQPHRTTVL